MIERIAIVSMLWGCGSDHAAVDAASADVAGDRAMPDAPGPVAWNAPVGDPIDGLTLFDGWEDPRVVPAPVNVMGGWTDSVDSGCDPDTHVMGASDASRSPRIKVPGSLGDVRPDAC